MNNITFDEFKKVEIRIGTIIEVEKFLDAIKPAYKLKVDLGKDMGIKESSAQITDIYSEKELIGQQVLVVVNLFPKKIGSFISECLITGFYNNEQKVILAVPHKQVDNGSLLL